jgi:hypothetical protein
MEGAVGAMMGSEQMELPLARWDEGMELKTQGGGTLQRWGSAAEACKVLFGMDRKALYALVRAGEIRGIKLGKAANSHYKIDLLSAWEYRAELLRGRE